MEYVVRLETDPLVLTPVTESEVVGGRTYVPASTSTRSCRLLVVPPIAEGFSVRGEPQTTRERLSLWHVVRPGVIRSCWRRSVCC